MNARRRFRNDAHAIAAARRFAAEELTDLPAELLEPIQLMLSELATNAIRHAGSAFEVSLERSDRRLKVAVTDEGGGTPTLRSPTPRELSGRGLQIVKMLARDWGIDQATSGHKTVWFTLELAGDAAATVQRRSRRTGAEAGDPPGSLARIAHRAEPTRRRPSDPHSTPTARADSNGPAACRARRRLNRR